AQEDIAGLPRFALKPAWSHRAKFHPGRWPPGGSADKQSAPDRDRSGPRSECRGLIVGKNLPWAGIVYHDWVMVMILRADRNARCDVWTGRPVIRWIAP